MPTMKDLLSGFDLTEEERQRQDEEEVKQFEQIIDIGERAYEIYDTCLSDEISDEKFNEVLANGPFNRQILTKILVMQFNEIMRFRAVYSAMKKLAADPKQKAKADIKKRWELWQKGEASHKNQTAFVRAMSDIYLDLNHDTISGWCRKWKKGQKA